MTPSQNTEAPHTTEARPLKMSMNLPVHKSADPFERGHFIVATSGGRVVCFTDGESDAEQIARACNSFDALTEANKKLVAALEYYAVTPSSYGQVARAALKAAKVTP